MHSAPTGRAALRNGQWPLDCLLGLPAWPAGPAWASVLPAWAPVLPFLAFRAPFGRHLDAKWTPVGRQTGASWTAKTAASVNVRLQDAKTAAESHRTPCQRHFCRRMATICNTSIYIRELSTSVNLPIGLKRELSMSVNLPIGLVEQEY